MLRRKIKWGAGAGVTESDSRREGEERNETSFEKGYRGE